MEVIIHQKNVETKLGGALEGISSTNLLIVMVVITYDHGDTTIILGTCKAVWDDSAT